jgi:hypothetical protein
VSDPPIPHLDDVQQFAAQLQASWPGDIQVLKTSGAPIAVADAPATPVTNFSQSVIAPESEIGSNITVATEQPRNALGQFMPMNPGDVPSGFNAVEDFANQAQANGFNVLGREVSFQTPFGIRRYDLILENPDTEVVSGMEIKSSEGAFDRWNAQQFNADRWINLNGGATSIGAKSDITIDSTYKILWGKQ